MKDQANEKRKLDEQNNLVVISGEITTPKELFEKDGETFYSFTISPVRNSGVKDVIPVVCPQVLLQRVDVENLKYVEIVGEYRSRNVKVNSTKNRLELFIFAKELTELLENSFMNDIQLTGYLVKSPTFRTTPFGRKICDGMIAVNRHYDRSDYIPLIIWNRKAEYFSTLKTGTKIFIDGRIQSREYDKEGTKKVAYEVSVNSYKVIKEDK